MAIANAITDGADDMAKKTPVTASPQPPLSPAAYVNTDESNVDHPASNATKPLQKRRVRANAQTDQAILQERGPNALPVSDYPLKKGPVAGNSLDLEQQARSRAMAKGKGNTA